MAYYEGHSLYQTDCEFFNWKFVNYDKTSDYGSMFSGGSRLYIPECGVEEAVDMFYRPIPKPCEGCPFYKKGTDKGQSPPGGYNV